MHLQTIMTENQVIMMLVVDRVSITLVLTIVIFYQLTIRLRHLMNGLHFQQSVSDREQLSGCMYAI